LPTCACASSSCGGSFDATQLEERAAELDHLSAQTEFWSDQAVANELLRERADIRKKLDRLISVGSKLDDAELLRDMGAEADDADAFAEATSTLAAAETELAVMELQRMLGGSHDKSNCFVSINAGAGGTESQDWAEMLLRMISRYCDRKGFKAELADIKPGQEAGIASATLQVEGEYAFGFLKAENGVHRLVRISPFDSQKRRHTSFASVAVLPEIDDDINIEIDESLITMEVFRASGAGGQHVNKTNSAVRLRYAIPDGGGEMVVECQAERSQFKNRSTAMKLMKARLYERELAKRSEERDALYAGKSKIDFGSQIRSYVLQPYQMVKDLRTGHETSNTTSVLDGDLDALIESYLLMTAGEGSPGVAE